MVNTIANALRHTGAAVWFLAPGASVYEALEKMAEKGVGALLVMEEERLVGVISERDYARKVVLRGRVSRDTPVGEIMSTGVICVNSTQSVDACMALMTRHRTRHLPIVESGQLEGIISIGDVVLAIIEDHEFTIEQLQHYITGTR